jgi:hypothetical protein
MTSNPYGKYIEGREPLRSLEETPRRIAALARAWPAAAFERSYAPGKWTAAQILVHLAQAEIVLATRLRFALAESGVAIQPFDQDAWMAAEPAVDGLAALDAYVSVRAMTLLLCRSLSAEQRTRTATHPDFGAISVEWMIEWLAGHELNHLPQFEAIAAA